ncbi:uncharacterized protein LOC129779567 [Toxorhynchites rutilus septentrionalis]|uniref:uncharacterized protein LOC129779567 n=1 Tax=Toxorhynchites rutilus septentrionalis TaxID=329112 RepID=UPI002479FAD4|nr:uncharacterized protein LOC129779567 [Toxorhynchites rutilus septentrionalis]
MGIRSMETFLRKVVPNGFFKINFEDEIRKYYDADPKAPAPIIVIDLMAMRQAMCQVDVDGQICGGRLKVAYNLMDEFFTRLKSCGAILEFICDGPLPLLKYGRWCDRQKDSYQSMLELYDRIDRGCFTPDLIMEDIFVFHWCYPLKQLARKHGRLIISYEMECDQQLAAYATNANALAILSNDTDYMIFAGQWHLWSSRDINFQTMSTLEYNRRALQETLQLSYPQMALLASLAGNHTIAYSEVQHFHAKLGKLKDKFHNLAHFIRQHPDNWHRVDELRKLLTRVFGRAAVNRDLIARFQHSLNTYKTNYRSCNLDLSKDNILTILQERGCIFQCTAWLGKSYEVSISQIDLRADHFGTRFPPMIVSILARQAGIILYHKRNQRQITDFSQFKLLIKPSHDADFSLHQHRAVFPNSIEPPSLVDLLSKEPGKRKHLQDIKLRIYSWIVSDTLSNLRLKSIPQNILVTAVTLYCLVENHLLKHFEADLLLQVAYDVINDKYDYRVAQLPLQLNGRAYRITFLYLYMYNELQNAFKGLGLNEEDLNDYPPFDGMLFQNRFQDSSQQESNLDEIRDWRIYDGLV